MTELEQNQFNHYRNIVHLFLNLSFFVVSRQLIPDDHMDRTLMPEAVSRSYDDVLFGGVLFDCPPRTACEITTPFHICFCALELEHKDGFAVMGPYLADTVEEDLTLEELLLQNGVALSELETYRLYFNRLPVVSQARVGAMMAGFAHSMYGVELAPELHAIDLTPQHPAPCPVFEEDAVQARADAIRQRYEREGQFMDAVARGDDEAVRVVGRVSLERLSNPLRNEKNLMIVLNTLLRKAVETAKVHPLYIDAISGKWALRIEGSQNVTQLDDLYFEMIRDYCALVRKHSLANFTPNVRNAIDCIHFNLSNSELSLKFISKTINVNASYLSHQFNQEVGMSIPEYIARLRVEEAQKLLRGMTSCSIGQIAAAVGMQDVNYFSKVFKRIAGCTPSVFRKRGRALL